MVEITFAVNGREYFEGLLISSFKRMFPRAGFLAFPIIMLVGLFGVLRVSDSPLQLLAYAAAVFAALLLLLAVVPALRAVQYGRDKRMSAAATWRIGYPRIDIRSERGELHTAWKAFERPTETRHLFLLYSAADKRSIYILPKRAFRDSVQAERFRELARKACGKIL
jgi:hypothetical protein